MHAGQPKGAVMRCLGGRGGGYLCTNRGCRVRSRVLPWHEGALSMHTTRGYGCAIQSISFLSMAEPHLGLTDMDVDTELAYK